MNKFYLCLDIPNRSNLPLQVFLWLNVHFFPIWSLTYGIYIFYKISKFWNLEGILMLTAYVASNVFEFVRLHSGYSGNLRGKPMHLNRFLILTPFVLLPILLFLMISAKDFKPLILSLTYALFGLMLLEFTFGVFTWQKLCAYQSQIYKLKQEMIFQKRQLIDED